jgi:hypothetical protein
MLYCPLPPVLFPVVSRLLLCLSIHAQLVNGDAVRETFQHVELPLPLWLSLFGDLFVYTYVLILMYVGLNTLIAVNEDAVFQSRYGPYPVFLALRHQLYASFAVPTTRTPKCSALL